MIFFVVKLALGVTSDSLFFNEITIVVSRIPSIEDSQTSSKSRG